MELKDPREILEMALLAARSRKDLPLSWLLSSFNQKARIDWDQEIATLKIKTAPDETVVLFNREFAESTLTVPDDALFVMLHEFMHLERGDYRSGLNPAKPIKADVAGMIEDIYINARICQLYFPQAAPFFHKLYNINRFPDILLFSPMTLDEHRIHISYENTPNNHSIWDFQGFEETYPWLRNVLVYPAFENVENLPEAYEEENMPEGGCRVWQLVPDKILPAIVEWYVNAWTRLDKFSLPDIYDQIQALKIDLCKVKLLGSVHGL